MNQIINRLRKSKRKLKQVFKMIKSDVDFEGDFVDSKLLNELSIISKINEELTDIIYMILDKDNEDKNSKKQFIVILILPKLLIFKNDKKK